MQSVAFAERRISRFLKKFLSRSLMIGMALKHIWHLGRSFCAAKKISCAEETPPAPE
jgi:hypothetical protein